MSNLSKLTLGKFVATIVALSSISTILSTAKQAEAFPAPTILSPGSSVRSNNQCFSLNAQADGNLVLYKQSNGQALWQTATYGRNVKQTIFQTDGNLVIYNTSNQPVWASNTDRRGATQLNVQDDGNVVMYNAQNQPIWATNTFGSCGSPQPPRSPDSLIPNTTMPLGSSIKSNNQCFSLNAQSDGNLVLYRQSNGQALWATGTERRNVKQTVFQPDGNLVIYNISNQAVWASNTDRRNATRVTVQDDGNLVMYNAQNQALWATNTITSCNTPPPPPPASPLQPVRNISNIPGNCHFGETCVLNAPQKHTGVDYMNPIGTQVSSICAGTVKYAFGSSTAIWDRFTIVEHKNCGGYATLYGYYGHINPNVRVGDSVSKGQVIGSVADYPVNNSHLHFGLSTQLPLNGWGYQVGTLSQSGWIDPIVFGRNSGWK